jgi:cyanobactin maturation PatA/PatG family protease
VEASAVAVPAAVTLVYALGQIDYDFASETRRDSFVQLGVSSPHDPTQMLAHLTENPAHATALTWTLTQETMPIYAIQPAGAFAGEIYARLREFLGHQLTQGVERVSIPGVLGGQTRLLNGQTIPVILPDLRGMFSWSTPALITAVMGKPSAKKGELAQQKATDIANFLERVYYEIRNLGITSQERAINFTATNAFQLEFVYRDAIESEMKLDSIDVERSPLCRPESDCWDVKLTFFSPSRRLEQARVVYRFTVDVSDSVPVTVGKVRHWHIY